MTDKKTIQKLWLIGVCLLGIVTISNGQTWNPGHKVGTVTGNYNFSYNQTPDQLVELFPAGIPNTGLTYQWEQSATPTTIGFAAIGGATQTSYTIAAPLTQTTYYRRKTTNSLSQSI